MLVQQLKQQGYTHNNQHLRNMEWTGFLVVAIFAIITWPIGYGLRQNLVKYQSIKKFKRELKTSEGLNEKGRSFERKALLHMVFFGMFIGVLLVGSVLIAHHNDFRWYWYLGFPGVTLSFAAMGYFGMLPGISLDL